MFFNELAAFLSKRINTSLWFLNVEAGHLVEISPFSISFTALALCLPVAIKIIFLDSRMSAMPTVRALAGARMNERKPKFELLVWCARTISRVRELKSEPGSLNAIWPFTPRPRIVRSRPPVFLFFLRIHYIL